MFDKLFSFDAWLLDSIIESFLLFALVYFIKAFFLRKVSAADRNFLVFSGLTSGIFLLLLNAIQTKEEIIRSYVAAINLSFVSLGLTIWCLGILIFLSAQFAKIIQVEIINFWICRSILPWKPSFYLELSKTLRLREAPNIYIDPETTSTTIQGLFNPIIITPTDFVSCPIEEQKQVLLHELSHYKRRDLTRSFISHSLVAIFWPVPMVWWLAHDLSLDNERACDDAVLEAGFQPGEYAETLIAAFERQPLTKPKGFFALAAIPPRNLQGKSIFSWIPIRLSKETTFHKRLLSIIDPKSKRQSNLRLRILCFITIIVGAYLCSQSNILASPLSPTSPATIRVPILTTSDDAEEDLATGEVMVASRDLDFSYDKQLAIHPMVGLRFCNINIPRGSKILSSHIVFVGDTKAKGSPSLSIACQKDPNPKPFLKRAADISGRFTGDEKQIIWKPGTDWYNVAQTEDTKTPDLKELVQELIDNSGWDLGHSIVFAISSNESDPNNYRESAAYDHKLGPQAAPVLEITYQRFANNY